MIRGVHHVALMTESLDTMVAFYRTHFGFEVVWECEIEGQERIAFLRTGNSFVEMFESLAAPVTMSESRPTTEAGYLHLALDVVDIDAAVARLAAAGAAVEGPPQDAGLLRFCFVADCEGNRIELIEIVDEHTPFALRRAGSMIAGGSEDGGTDDDDSVAVRRAGTALQRIANGEDPAIVVDGLG